MTLRVTRFALLTVLLLQVQVSVAQIDSQSRLSSAREDQDFTFASGLFRDQLYQLAAEQFDLFLKKYPTSVRRPEAMFLSGECSYFQKDYEPALQTYARLIREYPSSSLTDDAWFRTGQTQLALQRPAEAVPAFKKILDDFSASPLAGESAYWLGEAYDRQGDAANAVKYFVLSYEHFPANPYKDYAMYAVGWALQKDRKFTEAMSAYRTLIDSIPSSRLVERARVRIGECHFGLNDPKTAIAYLTEARRSLTEADAIADAEYVVAESYYRQSDFASAERLFQQFVATYPAHPRAPNATLGLGWTYLKLQRNDSAAAAFGRLAFRDGPLAHEASYRLAGVLRTTGRTDSAMNVLRAIPERFPSGEYSDDALVDLAELQLANRSFIRARDLATRAVNQYPQSNVRADALWIIGEANLAENDPALARPFFAEAAKSIASGREIQVVSAFRAAWSAFQSGMYDTAAVEFGAFRKSYTGHPRTEEALYWEAESEYRRGRFERALMLYKEAAASPDAQRRRESQYGMGWAAYKMGRHREAADAFGSVIAGAQKGPVEYDARLRQADALFAMKEFERAEQAYRTIVRMYPDTSANDIPRYQAAQCAFRRDDFAGAYKQFEDLIKTMPASPLADDAQYALGWINFRRKQYTEAVREFQKVIRTYPRGDVVPRAYYSLADAYYNMGQYEPAEKSYREVIRLFPESPYVADAITGLQYCLVAQGKKDDALSVIDQFVSEHPGSAASQSLVLKKAEIMASRGDLQGARRVYESFNQTYAASPLRGQSFYWLGRTNARLGDNASAFGAFRAAWQLPGTFKGPALLEALDIASAARKTEEALSLIIAYERSMTPADIRPDVALRKSRLYKAEGNAAESQRLLEAIVLEFPSHDASYAARLELARLALDESRFEGCRTLAQQVATARTDDLGAEGQYLIARAYAGERNWKDAVTAYLRVRYVYPSSRVWNDRAQLGLAEAYAASGDQTRARETLQQLLRGNPDAPIRAEAEKKLREAGG